LEFAFLNIELWFSLYFESDFRVSKIQSVVDCKFGIFWMVHGVMGCSLLHFMGVYILRVFVS